MSAQPPRAAVRLLTRALQRDPAAPAILGDLHEDFVEVADARGPAAARRWYWREALRLSLCRFGSARPRRPSSSAERARPARQRFDALWQDCAYGLRSLRRNPGFALFTAVVMGLGIGAATAVFSVMKPLVLAPLPFEEPHELVWIANEAEPGDDSLSAVTSRTANLVDFRARTRTMVGVTGFNAFLDHDPYTLTGGEEPELLVGADVAHDFLDVLGIEPLHGRGFLPEEGRVGGPRAVILSHDLWRRRLGGDEGVVGRSLSLNDRPYTVVGVLPRGFDFSSIFNPATPVDVLVPFPVIAAGEGGFQGNTLHMIGRLRPGVTVAAAQAELDAILAALESEDPGRWGLGAVVTPLQAHIAGPFRPALYLLAAAAGAFLLLVCVNVSNLILARSVGRAREIVVRKALGAARGRLMRQLVVETLLISLSGAALGGVLAWQVTRLVAGQAGVRIPLLSGVRVDGAALLFAVAAALVAGLLSGLFPAFKMAEGREASVLRDGGSGMSAGRSAHRIRGTLIVAQVALACVLLMVTGLLVRSFAAVLAVDLGFDAANTVAWKLNPGRTFDALGENGMLDEKRSFYAQLAAGVAEVRGVDEVGLIDELPLGINRSWPLSVVGAPVEDEPLQLFPHVVDPGYLPAMRIPLMEGRNLSPDDVEGTQPVVLINESGARRLFGDEPALGRRLRTWGDWEWEVVGVVNDVRHVSPETGAGIEVYFPIAQMPDFWTLDLVVRSRLPATEVAAAVRAAVREVDPAVPTREFWTIQSTVDRAVSARRFTLSVLAAFGAAALLVAGLGIYGVVAHAVAERVPEIGIRRALGASAPGVVWTVMSRTLLLAGAGTAAGALLALVSARLLAALVYGVGVRDPGTFAVSILVLLTVAVCAALVPATRAARTPGLVALGRDST